MNKIKQNKINFTLILIVIVVTFSSLSVLSLPVLFNYKSKVNKIEKNFYNNFKFYLKTTGNISYKPFPKPHLLVENASLRLDKENEDIQIVNTKGLKIFISLRDIYLRSFKNFISTEIINSNLEFKMINIKEIRNHLFDKINKPIILKNCKLFLKNKNDEVILISPIKKVTYKINHKTKNKVFLIDGKIFGFDFKSNWSRNYSSPYFTYHNINLSNPNVEIQNIFNFKNTKNFNINTRINYPQERLEYNLNFKNNIINITSPDEDKINFKLNSHIQLSPFFSNSELIISDKKIDTIIDNILLNLLLYNEKYLGNLSGYLKLKFNKLDNKIIRNGEINFELNEKKVKLVNSFFILNEIGDLDTNMNIIDKDGDLLFTSTNILNLKNHSGFSKILQIGKKKVKHINKIYFDLERKLGEDEFIIKNVRINNTKSTKHLEKEYIIKNIQNLRASFKKVIN